MKRLERNDVKLAVQVPLPPPPPSRLFPSSSFPSSTVLSPITVSYSSRLRGHPVKAPAFPRRPTVEPLRHRCTPSSLRSPRHCPQRRRPDASRAEPHRATRHSSQRPSASSATAAGASPAPVGSCRPACLLRRARRPPLLSSSAPATDSGPSPTVQQKKGPSQGAVPSPVVARHLPAADEMATKRQLSGIQKQVLSLYRGFLRAARSKAPEERRKIEEVVSTEFRHNSTAIDKKNFLYIEYLIRRGKRQLDQLKNPGTVSSSAAASKQASTPDSQPETPSQESRQGNQCEAAHKWPPDMNTNDLLTRTQMKEKLQSFFYFKFLQYQKESMNV
ncbi:hypothetical protein Taro_003502 [Colocasia esculenta]|uniref:Complex 1 LYR protein domain-containing protein n=1 Tax=Colocasia esculenta TaxID=4460 RepID=A0A843TLV3_COLES|nr:hypothetical protein [Colocasia esculenta]